MTKWWKKETLCFNANIFHSNVVNNNEKWNTLFRAGDYIIPPNEYYDCCRAAAMIALENKIASKVIHLSSSNANHCFDCLSSSVRVRWIGRPTKATKHPIDSCVHFFVLLAHFSLMIGLCGVAAKILERWNFNLHNSNAIKSNDWPTASSTK